MNKADRKLEKLHDEFYKEMELAIDKAQALTLPHILVQGLTLFFEIALYSAPTEFEARRLIKEVLNNVAKEMADKS